LKFGDGLCFVCIACVQSVKAGTGVDQLLDAKLLFKQVEEVTHYIHTHTQTHKHTHTHTHTHTHIR